MSGITMNKENLLTLIIPTYNRSKFLDYNLETLSAFVGDYPFHIIVCDNASDDNTVEIIKKWSHKFKFFKFIRQPENIGYARSVTTAYHVVETEYLWVLGDANTLTKEALCTVYEVLMNKKPTAIITSAKYVSLEDRTFNEINELLSEIGWYLTLLASTIIPKSFIKDEIIKRYIDTRFLHFGIFVENLSRVDNFNVIYLKNAKVQSINLGIPKSPKGRNSWQHTPFKIYGEAWFTFVLSLPNMINIETKRKCLLDYDKNTHFFGVRNLLWSKISGAIDYRDYNDNRIYMRWVANTPILFIDIIKYVPYMPHLSKVILKIHKYIRHEKS